MRNTLELFKAQDPRMASHAGQGKIFFHEKCTGNRATYDCRRINWMFATGFNPEGLQVRMISLMMVLQDGYHSDEYPPMIRRYPHAGQEYPDLYAVLAMGLDDATLTAMEALDEEGGVFYKPGAAIRFTDRLRADRQQIEREMAPVFTAPFATIPGMAAG